MNKECFCNKKECCKIIQKYLRYHGQKITLAAAGEEYEKLANFNYKYSKSYSEFTRKMDSDIAGFINFITDYEKQNRGKK